MKHYIIDFVYADNGQQFTTEADLTEKQVAKLENWLDELCQDGEITDPHVWQRGPEIHQTFEQAHAEIMAALNS